MQWWRNAVALGLTLMFAPTMVAACVLPFVELSQSERECCRKMATECGGGHMPTEHSCCTTTARNDSVMLATPKACSIDSPLVLGGVVDAAVVAQATDAALARGILSNIHDPPESPPISATVLRI